MRTTLTCADFRNATSALVVAVTAAALGAVPAFAQNRISLTQTYCTGSTPCVLAYHNDNNRDGVNPNETVLTPSTLSGSNPPTPRWMVTTDGLIYAQPLYIDGLRFNGVAHNVVYAVTENNTVYALDAANNGAALAGPVNLNNASDLGSNITETAVPWTDLPNGCSLLVPEVGITGTPVIDVSVTPPILYLVTQHTDVPSSGQATYRQKLHALYADTLAELPGSPVDLNATFEQNGIVVGFDPLNNLQRAGLALISTIEGADGTANVWVSWASNCDYGNYLGFEVGFEYEYSTGPASPGFTHIYEVLDDEVGCLNSCNGQGGIWMGGAAPAVDGNGNVFVTTGNGADSSEGTSEFSNSVLRLTETGSGPQDFYTPPDFDHLNIGGMVACTNPGNPPSCPTSFGCALDSTRQYCQKNVVKDWDLGSTGVVLLSPTFSLNPPELVTVGKQGMLYVVYYGDGIEMGRLDAAGQFPLSEEWACTPVASLGTPQQGAIPQCFLAFNGEMFGSLAFLGGASGTNALNTLYGVPKNGYLTAFQLNPNGLFTTTPVAATDHAFTVRGATPSITWNSNSVTGGINTAIVWVLDTSEWGQEGGTAAMAAVLYAYQAVPSGGSLGTSLWTTTSYDATNPGSPGAVKFVVPTIADGQIFLAGGAQNYAPDSSPNCIKPAPGTNNPTGCGAITMFK
jgi:hypothetical protein